METMNQIPLVKPKPIDLKIKISNKELFLEEKTNEIEVALETGNREELIILAREKYGFISDELRREAWKINLKIDHEPSHQKLERQDSFDVKQI